MCHSKPNALSGRILALLADWNDNLIALKKHFLLDKNDMGVNVKVNG